MGAMRLHWCLVPLLAACATAPHWEKPGSNETAMSEDLQQCRVQARLSTQTQQTVSTSPTGQTSSAPLADRGQERDAQEDQQIFHCMRGKGYNLTR